ncbi:IS110 family transposase [Actinoplanes regularis]|uniref:Transposase IS116/IS110/IS902 family protein n=1 Tax=Actinoplanes regularis TaxID=52697 RepID=A0A239EWZ1_9ACTN|nr:IS110 family transposase [Actinoplanes regularis]GIE89744.1 IS110 family transposase [Actinoplanes regularis]SNS49097.1 Transposase IS116/IS110/IS902 family protein [Actinoplanes regularis]
MIWIGDDWAEGHHDVELVDECGSRLARARLPEGLDGITRLHALIAEHTPDCGAELDPAQASGQVGIGIETDRGMWVQALLAASYRVYAINPMSVARYRERHSTSGAKSDQGDAHVLAEMARLDHAHHRQVAGDSPLAESVKLLARAHQSLVWDRTRQVLRLRSTLREFFPAALQAFDDLAASDALELLDRAPDPDQAARLARLTIVAVLRRAGRRDLEGKATRIQQILKAEQLRQPRPVQVAYAAIVSSQVQLINSLNIEISELGQVMADHFGRHRDAERYLSLPGLGPVLGARILGEFGDDPHRYTDAKARRNYAGTSPITRASGRRRVVLARYARNRRLADAVHQWAFCAMRGSPGARAYYQALRERGAGHQAALRQLSNRLVGILHGCLKTKTFYDEATAWAHLQPTT